MSTWSPVGDLADLGVVDRRVDDVGVGADHHDLARAAAELDRARAAGAAVRWRRSPPLPRPAAAATRPGPGHLLADGEARPTPPCPRSSRSARRRSRLVCAVESDDSAEVTEAWSESIWLVDAPDASSLASRSSADVSCAWAALTSSDRAVVADRGQHLPGGDRLARLHVHGGHRAGDGEVEVGLAGRLDRPRARHRLLDRARGHRHGDRRHREPGRRSTSPTSARASARRPPPTRTTTTPTMGQR